MLDADSPAACKLVFEIGRTLAERMAKTDETVAEVIARLEDAQSGAGDVDVFRDQLVRTGASKGRSASGGSPPLSTRRPFSDSGSSVALVGVP
jgi:hypothetical protein